MKIIIEIKEASLVINERGFLYVETREIFLINLS